tara:strand:+ start:463 stop:609 length:147 start_codon:yes stop_codon:yes gene_type:complete
VLLEGQLDDASDEFPLSEVSEEVSDLLDESPEDDPPPPPLQERTRRLK